MSNMIH